MDNRLFRNVPILLWWVAIIVTLFVWPRFAFVAVLVLVAAVPFKRAILSGTDVRPVPLCTINKFSELGNMTVLSAVKSMVYAGKLAGPSKHKISDRSKLDVMI